MKLSFSSILVFLACHKSKGTSIPHRIKEEDYKKINEGSRYLESETASPAPSFISSSASSFFESSEIPSPAPSTIILSNKPSSKPSLNPSAKLSAKDKSASPSVEPSPSPSSEILSNNPSLNPTDPTLSLKPSMSPSVSCEPSSGSSIVTLVPSEVTAQSEAPSSLTTLTPSEIALQSEVPSFLTTKLQSEVPSSLATKLRSEMPSSFSTELPSFICYDIEGWEDIDGDDCTYYESIDDQGRSYCSLFGGNINFANGGLIADDACCVCGGGTNAPPTPSSNPSQIPSSIPTLSSISGILTFMFTGNFSSCDIHQHLTSQFEQSLEEFISRLYYDHDLEEELVESKVISSCISSSTCSSCSKNDTDEVVSEIDRTLQVDKNHNNDPPRPSSPPALEIKSDTTTSTVQYTMFITAYLEIYGAKAGTTIEGIGNDIALNHSEEFLVELSRNVDFFPEVTTATTLSVVGDMPSAAPSQLMPSKDATSIHPSLRPTNSSVMNHDGYKPLNLGVWLLSISFYLAATVVGLIILFAIVHAARKYYCKKDKEDSYGGVSFENNGGGKYGGVQNTEPVVDDLNHHGQHHNNYRVVG